MNILRVVAFTGITFVMFALLTLTIGLALIMSAGHSGEGPVGAFMLRTWPLTPVLLALVASAISWRATRPLSRR